MLHVDDGSLSPTLSPQQSFFDNFDQNELLACLAENALKETIAGDDVMTAGERNNPMLSNKAPLGREESLDAITSFLRDQGDQHGTQGSELTPENSFDLQQILQELHKDSPSSGSGQLFPPTPPLRSTVLPAIQRTDSSSEGEPWTWPVPISTSQALPPLETNHNYVSEPQTASDVPSPGAQVELSPPPATPPFVPVQIKEEPPATPVRKTSDVYRLRRKSERPSSTKPPQPASDFGEPRCVSVGPLLATKRRYCNRRPATDTSPFEFDEWRKRRDRNNESVRKTRAKKKQIDEETRQRLQELEAETSLLKQRLAASQAELRRMKNNFESLLKASSSSSSAPSKKKRRLV